jgi:hypothetical protein
MITLLCLALPPVAAAGDDCPADADRAAAARNEFENGRRYEAAGEAPSALMTYLLARDYDCEDRNGIGGAAARRVVPLARQLGREQEVEGNLLMAYSIYDSGGLFAEADRALMQLASDVEGGVGFQSQAREHFQQRLEPGFAAANRLKLQAAGPYTASREPLERLAALPPHTRAVIERLNDIVNRAHTLSDAELVEVDRSGNELSIVGEQALRRNQDSARRARRTGCNSHRRYTGVETGR